MNRHTTERRRGVNLAGVLLLALLASTCGCHHYGNVVALPGPVGASVNQAADIQAQNAAQDDFVIYYNEWLGDSAVLGPAGKKHLDRIVKEMPGVPFTVWVQPTPAGNIDLDRARRDAIVTVLSMRQLLDADKRVQIGDGVAEGLDGNEAERIYDDMLNGGGGQRGGLGGLGGSPIQRHIGPGPWWGELTGNRGGRGRSLFGF